jgi:hypothetical protein
MAEDYGLYDREALPNAINVFLNLAEQTWLRVAALMLGSFLAGMLVHLLLWELDGSRAQSIKIRGAEMARFGNYLQQIKSRISMQDSAKIRSYFASAKKFGIWAPDDQVVTAHTRSLIADYLTQVGTMLQHEHFRKAKQYAKDRKAAFDKAKA